MTNRDMATNEYVVVIGAGPAGLSCALELDRQGVNVCIVDEEPAAGGQVYRSVGRNTADRASLVDLLGQEYTTGRALVSSLDQSGIVQRFNTSLFDITIDDSTDCAATIGLVANGKAEFIRASQVVIAAGAMERPTPFPGWTLPGVMTVGAAQTLLKSSGMVPDSEPVIVGTGPLVYLYMTQLIAAGVKPARLIDTGPADVSSESLGALLKALPGNMSVFKKGLAWKRTLQQMYVPVTRGLSVLQAIGNERIEGIQWQDTSGQSLSAACEVLLVHDGVVPNTYLSMAAGCEHRWNTQQRYWEPVLDAHRQTTVEGIYCVGDGAGVGGADLAIYNGKQLGQHLAQHLGPHRGKPMTGLDGNATATAGEEKRAAATRRLRQFLDAHYKPASVFQQYSDDTVICRCEGVTALQLREVASLGSPGPNQTKAFSRCGMGPCMGRQCGLAVSQILADWHGKSVNDIGHYRIRPPLKPITVGELAEADVSALTD